MGLPLPNGKLAMWLFLVTEIMFFTALIGVYLILRNGTPDHSPFHWPAPHEVHLVEWIGALNTFVLICSSLTVVLAHHAVVIGKFQQATHLRRRHAGPGRRLPRHQGLRVQRQVRARHPARPHRRGAARRRWSRPTTLTDKQKEEWRFNDAVRREQTYHAVGMQYVDRVRGELEAITKGVDAANVAEKPPSPSRTATRCFRT